MRNLIRRIPITAVTQFRQSCNGCSGPLARAYAHYLLKGLYCSPRCIADNQYREDLQVPEHYRNGARFVANREA